MRRPLIRTTLLAGLICSGITKIVTKLVQVETVKEFAYCFSTHFGDKLIWIIIREILIIFWKSIQDIQVFFFA